MFLPMSSFQAQDSDLGGAMPGPGNSPSGAQSTPKEPALEYQEPHFPITDCDNDLTDCDRAEEDHADDEGRRSMSEGDEEGRMSESGAAVQSVSRIRNIITDDL
jgi:hypothetical protein